MVRKGGRQAGGTRSGRSGHSGEAPGKRESGRSGDGRKPGGKQDSPGRHVESEGASADPRHEVDALFQLPLAEFTAARNALAARLRKARKLQESESVKALPRPSLVAWAVNQLYWRHRDRFDHLLATGERFYDAQVAHLSGGSGDLRGALDARREALSDLTRRAADVLRAAGHAAAPDTMRRITTTLEALSSSGSAPQTPQAGRLTDEVLPPGFEALAPLVTRVSQEDERPEGPTRVLPFRPAAPGEPPPDAEALRQAAHAAARAALEEAERSIERARVRTREAEMALKQAAARTKETEKEKTAAEARLAELTTLFEEARAEALRIAAQAEEAAQALDEAERARDAARTQLQELEVSG